MLAKGDRMVPSSGVLDLEQMAADLTVATVEDRG